MAFGGASSGFKRGRGRPKRAEMEEPTRAPSEPRPDRRHSSMRAIKVATSGVAPIEVIVSRMRHAWEVEDYETASKMAEIALPYTTPRLAAATITHRDALDDLTIDQLRTLLAAAERAARTLGGEVAGEAGTEIAGNAHRVIPTLQ